MHNNLNLRDGGWGAGKVLILQIEDNCGEDPGSEVDYGHHCNVNKKRVNGDDSLHIRDILPALNIMELGELSPGQNTPMVTVSNSKQKKLRRTPITKGSLFLG